MIGLAPHWLPQSPAPAPAETGYVPTPRTWGGLGGDRPREGHHRSDARTPEARSPPPKMGERQESKRTRLYLLLYFRGHGVGWRREQERNFMRTGLRGAAALVGKVRTRASGRLEGEEGVSPELHRTEHPGQ